MMFVNVFNVCESNHLSLPPSLPPSLSLSLSLALTADELLPILVYLVIISDIPNWHGNIAYINNFHFSRIGVEEFAYVCLLQEPTVI